jgi:hypothetical protein
MMEKKPDDQVFTGENIKKRWIYLPVRTFLSPCDRFFSTVCAGMLSSPPGIPGGMDVEFGEKVQTI